MPDIRILSGGRLERLEEERVNHLEEVEEAKVRMEEFDKQIKATLGVDGEDGDEETSSVVSHHLNCHLALALHHRCHLKDWQHIDFEGGEAAQGGRWEGGGEEVNKITSNIFTFTKRLNIISCLTVAILTKIRVHHDHLTTRQVACSCHRLSPS